MNATKNKKKEIRFMKNVTKENKNTIFVVNHTKKNLYLYIFHQSSIIFICQISFNINFIITFYSSEE